MLLSVPDFKLTHYQRFLWILVTIIFVDAILFSNMENWAAPLVIGILELIGIVILADRCKVDTVVPAVWYIRRYGNQRSDRSAN